MTIDAWLPRDFTLPDGTRLKRALHTGADWQIYETAGDGRALLAREALADRWIASGVAARDALLSCAFGADGFRAITAGSTRKLVPIQQSRSPNSRDEAISFAAALRATREIDQATLLDDAIYAESITRLLPTYTVAGTVDDALLLGRWLSGGAPVSVAAFDRLSKMLSWLSADDLRRVVEQAGLRVMAGAVSEGTGAPAMGVSGQGGLAAGEAFSLPGRPDLAAFFDEHVVDVVRHAERYRALGIGFPAPIVLHGPPGCGKTFAVEKLVEFLGWPSFAIDATSVASPYIHETSRKVAQVFEQATRSAPAVLVIDEMEAFLADREIGAGSSHHRVEEVAEFLRRIPEASKHQVLIVGMTNRIDMIDPAILRRGRFDHVIKLDPPSASEVRGLLGALLEKLPHEDDIDIEALAGRLAGRPLSDAAFVVREAGRLAAKSGKGRIDRDSLQAAIKAAPSREPGEERRIGFQID